jgi:hypothetical protein
MIAKMFSFLTSKTGTKDQLKNIKLVGSFHRKVLGKKIEEIAEECTLYMSIVNENTFDYNLNVYNDDYKFNNDSWELKSYPINNDRGFKTCMENDKEAIIWEENKEFFIFYIFTDENNTKYKDEFLKILNHFIISYEYELDLAKASEKDEKEKESYVTDYSTVDNINEFLEDNYVKFYGKPSEEEAPKDDLKIDLDSIAKGMSNVKINQLFFRDAYPKAIQLFQSKGNLFKYDLDADKLVEVSKSASFQLFKVQDFKYYLVVDDLIKDSVTLTMTAMSQESNIIVSSEENLIMWLSKEGGQTIPTAWNFVFSEVVILDDLRRILAKVKYESGSLSKYEDLNAEDQDWLENENMPDDSLDDIKDIEMEMENEFQESTSENPNKATTQAYLHDRTFVVRENNTIGVYKTDEDDVLTVSLYIINSYYLAFSKLTCSH